MIYAQIRVLKSKKKLYDKLKFTQKQFIDKYEGKLVTLYPHQENNDSPVEIKSNAGITIPKDFYKEISEEDVFREIMGMVWKEIGRARKKYPHNRFMTDALTEETGEAIQAIIDFSLGAGNPQNIPMEIIQVMAVSYRLLMEGAQHHRFQGLYKAGNYVEPAA